MTSGVFTVKKMAVIKRSSLQDVAERAGVSRMTASNVMRGRADQMAPDTRERVLQALEELQYKPVAPPTRQNSHVETRVLGLLMDSIEFEDIWGAPLYRGLRIGARAAGYDLLTLLRPETGGSLGSGDVNFLDRRSDGFIVVVPHQRERLLETLVEHGIPVVTCSLDAGVPGVGTVLLDNEGAMEQAVAHLIDHEHQKIGFISTNSPRYDHKARESGYAMAMVAAGLSPCYFRSRAREPRLWDQALGRWLKKEQVTAIVAPGDSLALRVWQACDNLGVRIPQDLSLTGLDDLPESEMRGLTTLSLDTEAMGVATVQCLVQLVNGEKVEQCHTVIPVYLISRQSVARPAHLP